jgi:ketosteroid isomerase-like protein
MTMKRALLGAALAMMLASGASVTASEAADKAAVQQVLEKYLRSVDGADVTLAEQVWSHAADIVVVTPFGRFEGWDAVRNAIYVNFLQKGFSERKLEGSNVAVRVSGDTAWLVYDWTFTAKTADSQPVNSKGWESHVYQRTRQGWRIVSLHYSVPPPPPQR